MSRTFDLVVIGSGSAASPAMRCREAGWEVAVIDSRPYGGTCALRGCDPKKVLVGATEAVEQVRRLEGKGVRSRQFGIDWAELMRFKGTIIESVPEGRRGSFSEAGIETFDGHARFIEPAVVQVGSEVLEARYVVIASGAKPVDLKVPGEEYLTTSDQFLDLGELPARIVFVGGGFISFEFAHIAARAGAQVSLLHRSARPLKEFDPDLVQLLVERTRKLGVEVHLETELVAVDSSGNSFTVQASTPDEGRSFEADLVVHGAGRVPDIDGLDLDKAGVEHDRRGVRVNEYLQSVSNPSVYAAGDAAASGPPLTPVASYEGDIVAANLIEGNHRKVDHPPIPSVVFTVPPLASVGLQEEAARDQGLNFSVRHEQTSDWYSSRRVGEQYSGYKVLVEEGTGQILGAHLLGPQAEETINLFTMAMKGGMQAAEVEDMIFAYPTHASDIVYMV